MSHKINKIFSIHKGFTLLEFIVVIIIMAIVSSYAVFRWNGSKLITRSQASRLVSDIRYTQSLAMTKNTSYRINILSNTSYNITDQVGNVILNPTTQSSSITLENGNFFNTITNMPNNLMSFDGKGIPYVDSSASTPLASTASIQITNNSIVSTVYISPQTGYSYIN